MREPRGDVTVSEERVVLASLLLAASFMALSVWALGRPVAELGVGRFLLFVGAGVVAHEALHVLGWMVAGRIPARSFRLGVLWRYGTLYAHCDAAMPLGAYRVGGALPGVLTGVAPWLAGLLMADLSLALAGALLTAGAAGDAAVLWASRGVSRGVLVEDHPTEVGLRLLSGEGIDPAPGRRSAP